MNDMSIASVKQTLYSRRFVLRAGTGLLIVVYLLMALQSYSYSLPYIDHVDEPNYYLGGLDERGLYDMQGYFDGVLSGYLHLSALIQMILEPLGIDSISETIPVMRLLSVVATAITLIFIALGGKLVSNHEAGGLVAAGLWAMSPFVLENSIRALPDPFVNLTMALALYLALAALFNENRVHWLIYSCLAGLMAVILKYLVVALIPPFLVALILTFKQPRQHLKYLIILTGLTLLTAFWAIFIYGAAVTELPREGNVVASSGLQNLLNFQVVWNNVLFTVRGVINPVIFAGLFVLAGAAFWFNRRGRKIQPHLTGIMLLLVSGLSVAWLAALYSRVGSDNMRYVLPGSVAFAVIAGWAVCQISCVVSEKRQMILHYGLAGCLLLAVFSQNVFRLNEIVTTHQLPDQRVAIRQWVEDNLNPGWFLIHPAHGSLFNPFWGGLEYAKWFDWYVTTDITGKTLETWRTEFNIRYAALTLNQVERLQATAEGQAYLEEMVRLRSFIWGEDGRGPDTVLYRLRSIPHRLNVQFGEFITLAGMDTLQDTYQPGDVVPVQLYWQADQTPSVYYSGFVHLMPLNEETLITQADAQPGGEQQPTITWNQPEQIIIGEPLLLNLPVDLAPGDYRVHIGLYNPETGVRLPINDGRADSYQLMTLTITDPSN